MTPSVDIAIPTHGTPRYLAEAIGSVLAQTHGDLTLRISDNGPGGGAAARVVERFRDDPRLVYTATGGVSGTENWTRCFRAGTAPYVAVLPHDEQFDPGWVADRVAFLEAHPECAFAFGSVTIAEDDRVAEPRHRFAEGVHPPETFVPALYERNVIGTSTILLRRSALEAAGAYLLEDVRMADDWELWFRIAVRFPVGYLAVRDSFARDHAESVTSGSTDWGDMHLRIVRRFDELLAEAMPGFSLPAGLRERRLAEAHLLAAIEALEADRRRVARAHIRRAARAHPAELLHARGLAALAAALGGRPAQQAVARLRAFERRARVRYHLGELALRLRGA